MGLDNNNYKEWVTRTSKIHREVSKTTQ